MFGTECVVGLVIFIYLVAIVLFLAKWLHSCPIFFAVIFRKHNKQFSASKNQFSTFSMEVVVVGVIPQKYIDHPLRPNEYRSYSNRIRELVLI